MKSIPENIIPKVSNYSKKAGDFVRTMSLDLSSEYGSIRPTKLKQSTSSATTTDLELAVAFAAYNNDYFLVTDDFVYTVASGEMQDPFTKVTTSGAPTSQTIEAHSDAEVFNGSLYVSGNDEVFKFNGSTWSTPVTTKLTANTPHLMAASKVIGNSRLYITDDFYKVHSINTSDVISDSGTATLDLGLDDSWIITFLETGLDVVWVGLLNRETNRGMIIEWDGISENIYNRKIELFAGVVAGCVLDNIPYVLDITGRLLRFTGVTFAEVDRLNKKRHVAFDGVSTNSNLRFVHPNGMTATDTGKILILVSNQTDAATYEDAVPSGVYEYDQNIGLYQKYSIQTSGTYAHHRIEQPGAILWSRAANPDADNDGVLLVGAGYSTSTGDEFGVFYSHETKLEQAVGHFETSRVYASSVQEAWKEVYALYDEIINASDKIVVKYRVTEKNSINATINWTDQKVFTTTSDISNAKVGDEVTILSGAGAGQAMHITSIASSASTYTVTVDENPLSATGQCSVKVDNYTKVYTSDNSRNLQYNTFNLTKNSPWIQFKVILYLTNTEFHKLKVKSSTNI